MRIVIAGLRYRVRARDADSDGHGMGTGLIMTHAWAFWL
jgi:hypothetical protein